MNMNSRIIGFAGKKGSGKDMLGRYLINTYGYQRYAFGDSVKEICRHLFGFNDEQLYGDKKEEITNIGITPREAFQKIGTDFGRKEIHNMFPSININKGEIWIEQFKKHMEKNKSSKYVITDVRFDNEAEIIREYGGLIIYIDSKYSNKKDIHESEQIKVKHDYIIHNNSSKEEIYEKLDNIISRSVK